MHHQREMGRQFFRWFSTQCCHPSGKSTQQKLGGGEGEVGEGGIKSEAGQQDESHLRSEVEVNPVFFKSLLRRN